MIVVADTSPINYLLLIKEIDILPKMYGKVVIPRAVHEVLLRVVAPEIVRAWIGEAPFILKHRSRVVKHPWNFFFVPIKSSSSW